MTDWEKAVVMAYTGVVMLSGDKLGIYYRYIQEKLGRPVWTHEFADKEMAKRIKEAAKSDFLALCADEEQHFWPSSGSTPKERCCRNCEHHKPYPLNTTLFYCGNVCSDYFNVITENNRICDAWREKA